MIRPAKSAPDSGDYDHETGSVRFDLVGRGMEQWRQQRPDIDCSGKAVIGRVLMLQDIILKRVNQALAPHGLRYPSYAVLATLRVAGHPFRLSPSRLQATMLFTSGGISNLLSRLEEQGFVRRSSDPADKRGVWVELTDEGLAIVEPAMVDHAKAERELCTMLSTPEQEGVANLLSRMIVLNRDHIS
ncbi:MarR family transcriptional regulator [Acidisoma cellulosilytica]|uniref:MarR family transcriptional regulator n=1 Tax=Acidisoma cellulosilyticum TaxID=2802395 RepID=A0A964E5R9_9PROT|nr:MarR family transcriptional regulator [Acidisoma cellulosilyticum]MCB8882722.1 MarR family transcriptional regulator [Acidisoma cellulosilyticum]